MLKGVRRGELGREATFARALVASVEEGLWLLLVLLLVGLRCWEV